MARFGRFKVSKRNKINIGRVITKISITVIALWVGGEILTKVANAMNGTDNVFLKGLTLVGFQTFGDRTLSNSTEASEVLGCDTGVVNANCLDGTLNTTGILSVVGLVAMASIVMEFVNVRMT